MKRLERLSSGDTLFLDVESNVNSMYVSACLIFDAHPLTTSCGGLDYTRIFDFIRDRVSLQPRYRKRVATTPIEKRPVWVDAAKFEIEDHVRHERLPSGSGEDQLKERCAGYATEPLDPEKPLWAIRVIEGFAPDRFAIVVKAHHCMADGVASIHLVQALLSNTPQISVESHRPQPRPRAPRRRELFVGEVHDRIDDGLRLARHATRLFSEPREATSAVVDRAAGLFRVLAAGLHPASTTPLDVSPSARRHLDWMMTDLTRISEIRLRQGGTLNDVVLATVSMALGKFLEAHGISRSEQKEMELRVAVPVDMRQGGSRAQIGNRISMIFAKIPVGEEDPLVVLDQTRESLASSKDSGLAKNLGSLLDLADWVPRFVTRPLTRWAMASHPANLVLTNIRGPAEPLYLLESRLLEVYPTVPLMPNQSLAVAVLSYSGRLYWGLHADRERFASLDDWSEYTKESFDQLYAAAMLHSERSATDPLDPPPN